ncbi:MAG TPA: T9SS type A sorting domain-containing protein, partial [Ignavibacteria bacterium]
PLGGNTLQRSITRFCIIDNNILIGVNGYRDLPNSRLGALVWKTTNGGNNWGFQDIDTSFRIGVLLSVDFINSNTGFAFQGNGVKTINGGGTILFTYIRKDESLIKGYFLEQNYPNPFNPITKIPYELKEPGYIVLKVYDITGRIIKELVNGRWGTGKYIADFDGTGLSSGTYFYRIEITGEATNERFSDSKKMVLIK